MASSFNKFDLLTDIDILLMVKKGIRGGTCRSIYRYSKANNMINYDKIYDRYMIDYDKNT